MIQRDVSGPAAPASTLRATLIAFVAAAALCWPMLLLTAPLMFPDSAAYVSQGSGIAQILIEPLTASGPADGHSNGSGGMADASSQAEYLRSLPYAAFTYLTSIGPWGLLGPPLVQGVAVLLLLGAIMNREWQAPRREVALAVAGCATLTSLPFFVSYLMPDLLAAAVILYAAMLIRGFDELTGFQRLALGAVATLAVVSHYGHIPLAVACIGTVLALRWGTARLTRAVAIAGVAPIVLALGMNAALGVLVLDGPSAAPRRLPVLLARSIEDGPARRHLQQACASKHYATCDLVDELPATAGGVLFGDEGIAYLSTEKMQRIRAEEPIILWRAFKAYPLEQTWALVRNVAYQLTSLGTDDFRAATLTRQPDGEVTIEFDSAHHRTLLQAFGWIHAVVFVAGVLAFVLLALVDGLRAGSRERELVALLVIGLLANAAIFGGLSAPADRYQSRVAWLVPVFAALFVLERRRQASTRHASTSGALNSHAEAG